MAECLEITFRHNAYVLSIQAGKSNVWAWVGVTAFRNSQSNTPDFGTLQFESRLRCYHAKSNAI